MTRRPSARVTSIGSPVGVQPWRTPTPSGASEPSATATTPGATAAPCSRAGAPPPTRGTGDAGAGDAVGAADDLLLVAGGGVDEEQQRLVRAVGDVAEARRRLRAGVA